MSTILTQPCLAHGKTPCCQDAGYQEETKPCKQSTGWRRIVRNFTPSWFAVNMGTGITSILLHEFPYNAQWLRYISYICFGLNVLLFTIFLALTITRYVAYPEIWGVMIAHPAQSLFLGCFPMAFATIINMMILTCSQWGDWLIYTAWVFWWVDVWLSLATCISMPFIVMHRHRPLLENITAALLLPIVPSIVAAASGGIMAEVLPSTDHAVMTLITSYILWGIGEFFTGCVLALYFHRLTVHSIPPKEVVVSVFLPIGPLGQGGFGIQQLGKVAAKVLPGTTTFGAIDNGAARAGEILYTCGVFLAIMMWGFGVAWMTLAFITIATMKKFPFNMGWWGFTFPLGVLATCTGLLAKNLDSDFFKVTTAILSLLVVSFWLLVAIRTTQLALTGEIFHAPCLQNIQKRKEQQR